MSVHIGERGRGGEAGGGAESGTGTLLQHLLLGGHQAGGSLGSSWASCAQNPSEPGHTRALAHVRSRAEWFFS